MNTFTTCFSRALSALALLCIRGGRHERRMFRISAMLFLLPLLAPPHANAIDWAANYGTALASTQTQATAVDPDGNVYITGYFDGATLTLGSVTLSRIGYQDAFVAKLDASGVVLWAKNHGGSGAGVTAKDIAVDVSGNVYLTGYFMSGDLTAPALTRIGHANADAYAFKLDASGNTVWAKNYGGYSAYSGSAFASGQGVAVDGSGNVYLCGYFAYMDITTPTLTKIGIQDAFAFKLDASGNTIWTRNYGGTGAWAQCEDIAVDGSGNVYLGGGIFDANLTTPALTLIGGHDAFAFKLDASGNTLWARNYGGIGATTHSRGIAVDGSGNVYLGGYFEFANLTTPALTKIGSGDVFALKLDASGSTAWATNYGGSGATAYGYDLALDATGNVYIGGVFYDANLATPTLTLIGAQDAFALRLDASGNATWAGNYGGGGANVDIYGIAADGSGNIYLGGSLYDANLTTPMLTKISDYDALILKVSTVANLTTYTGPTATGTGMATATVSGGGATCGFTAAQFVPLTGHPASPPTGSAPVGISFPHGLFEFTLGGCTLGDTVTLNITYPQTLPTGAVYWKYGPTPGPVAAHWYQLPSTIVGNTATFSITDGGLGDDDLAANGVIVDQGGPGVPGGSTIAIPTLSEWALLMLAGMTGLFGVGALRRE